MPGLMIDVSCICGYETVLHPGCTNDGTYYAIAYSKDESELITVDFKEATEMQLKIVEDPCIKGAASLDPVESTQYFENRGKPVAGPRCPKCKEKDLTFIEIGNWD